MKFVKFVIPIVLWFALAACSPSAAEITAGADRAKAETQSAASSSTATDTPGPTASATPGTSPTPSAAATATGGSGLLAFASNRLGPYQIFAMKTDGEGQRQIVEADLPSYFPEFSPDGEVLLLWVADLSAVPPIYGIRFWFGGVDLSQIFPFLGGTWSPNGQKIAATFVQEGAEDTDIGIIDISGEGFSPLTTDLADDEQPDWVWREHPIHTNVRRNPLSSPHGCGWRKPAQTGI